MDVVVVGVVFFCGFVGWFDVFVGFSVVVVVDGFGVLGELFGCCGVVMGVSLGRDGLGVVVVVLVVGQRAFVGVLAAGCLVDGGFRDSEGTGGGVRSSAGVVVTALGRLGVDVHLAGRLEALGGRLGGWRLQGRQTKTLVFRYCEWMFAHW